MAETEDELAHLRSLPGWHGSPKELDMLDGNRFGFHSNVVYKMPTDNFVAVKEDPVKLAEMAREFITDHYNKQVYRVLTLERYYNGDNDIHYWFSHKAQNRADNRIASGIPAYITNIRVGYTFGNPVKFQYNKSDATTGDGDDINEAIKNFNAQSDETYHEKVMKKKLSVTGRAYELLYVRKDTNEINMACLDPSNCFVVYDATVEHQSLFAVYYYPITFGGDTQWYITIYTSDSIYVYKPAQAPTDEVTLDHVEEHYFGGVPITEYINNDERMGDWERELDYIDAYDKSLSEMANSQEDFSNAVLVLTGDVEVPTHNVTDADGNVKEVPDTHPNIDRQAAILWLKPKTVNSYNGNTTVVTPTAEYLTKQLPAADWQTYINAIIGDTHKFTNTPNVNDENFAANASGVAMSYKLWGSDQERSIQESLYQKGLMRRLRLLATYWVKYGVLGQYEEVNNITPVFTPNLPKNDAEIVTNLKTLSDTGQFSGETLHAMAEPVTGIKPDEEQQRMDDQKAQEPQIDPNLFNDPALNGSNPPVYSGSQAVNSASQSDSAVASNSSANPGSD